MITVGTSTTSLLGSATYLLTTPIISKSDQRAQPTTLVLVVILLINKWNMTGLAPSTNNNSLTAACLEQCNKIIVMLQFKQSTI